ncbi:hypothetical protein ACFLUC_03385 [Chloroflexota bacterium]
MNNFQFKPEKRIGAQPDSDSRVFHVLLILLFLFIALSTNSIKTVQAVPVITSIAAWPPLSNQGLDF